MNNNDIDGNIMINDNIINQCDYKFERIFNLSEPGFSIYKIKDYGAFQTNFDEAA